MKLLFVQLPLIDHGRGYIMDNVPYAPSAMAGFIKKTIGKETEIDHVPFVIANFGSNREVIKYIRVVRPDAVCFTCYLWNVERSLAIAREIKRMTARIRVYMGGPEIQPGSWVLSEGRDCVDYFVSGEGEWFFTKLAGGGDLTAYTKYPNGNRLLCQPETELTEASEIVEPLGSGYMHAMADGSAFIEMTRGCPYRCAYCFYSKNCSGVRELSLSVLLKALKQDKNLGLNELYILSPTFNTSRDFKSKLKAIAAANRGIRLHTEMRTDGIDRETARLIHTAGFRSLEVGLQTLTGEALARIGRKDTTRQELRGMKELQKAGIELKIGIIPGLPGDSPKGFMKTVTKLAESGFKQNMEIYPLCMLPGTRIRDEGDEAGVLYQKKPPYYFLGGWGFSFDDMKNIITGTEMSTGFTHTIGSLPDFTCGDTGILNGGIRITSGQLLSGEGKRFTDIIQTAVFNFFITVTPGNRLMEGLERLFEAIPWEHQLYNIILYTGGIIKEKPLVEMLLRFDSDSLTRRLHVFDEWKEGLSAKIFQVLEDVEAYGRAVGEYELITPVLRLTVENRRELIERNEYTVEDLLIAGGAYEAVREYLENIDDDSGVRIGFENEQEQEEYYRMKGQEYIRWPFTLAVTDARFEG